MILEGFSVLPRRAVTVGSTAIVQTQWNTDGTWMASLSFVACVFVFLSLVVLWQQRVMAQRVELARPHATFRPTQTLYEGFLGDNSNYYLRLWSENNSQTHDSGIST